MSEIGEIKYGNELGKKKAKNGKGSAHIFLACPDCGKERWIETRHGKPISTLCPRCNCLKHNHGGKEHWNWKGGRKQDGRGYILIKLTPDDFFYLMANRQSYVMEHRLVMARHLGRCLQSWEKVHHKDGIKNHNEYSNLELTTNGSHSLAHSKGYKDGYQKGIIDGKEKQIAELRILIEEQTKQIKLLQWQVKERV